MKRYDPKRVMPFGPPKPAFAPIPKFPMRILFGELAGPLLFEGQKVIPEKLIQSGFKFTHENLEDALRDCLGKWR